MLNVTIETNTVKLEADHHFQIRCSAADQLSSLVSLARPTSAKIWLARLSPAPPLHFCLQSTAHTSAEQGWRTPQQWWPQSAETTDHHQLISLIPRPSVLLPLPLCSTRMLASSGCQNPSLRARTGIWATKPDLMLGHNCLNYVQIVGYRKVDHWDIMDNQVVEHLYTAQYCPPKLGHT